MDKRKIKIICILIILILYQSSTYFLTKLIQASPFLLSSILDDKIPYIPQFVFFYIIWYPMLFAVPLIIYIKGQDTFYKYITSYIISVLICGVIFILFPTTVNRVDINSTDISNTIVKLLYSLDEPAVNCLPSIHCLIAFLFIFGTSKIKISYIYKITIYILSILIILSTFLIKQHVIYDAVAALVIAAIVWTIISKRKIHLKIKALLDKS